MEGKPKAGGGGSKMDMFIVHFKEDADHNQYWYSKSTAKFVAE